MAQLKHQALAGQDLECGRHLGAVSPGAPLDAAHGQRHVSRAGEQSGRHARHNHDPASTRPLWQRLWAALGCACYDKPPRAVARRGMNGAMTAGSSTPSRRQQLQEAAHPAPPLSPPPPPPPSRVTPAGLDASLDRRLFLFSLVLHGCTQLISLLQWSALPPSERAQRLGSVAWLAAFPLLAALAPRFYLRHRTAALALQRVVFFLFPLLRRPRGECAVDAMRDAAAAWGVPAWPLAHLLLPNAFERAPVPRPRSSLNPWLRRHTGRA